MATYTVYVVTRNARHHYPVIMANNGKAILNEPVKRAQDLERSVNRFLDGALWNSKDIPVIRITEKAFKAKFPKYAANKGPKKKAVKKWTPKAGYMVIVFRRKYTVGAFGWVEEMDALKGVPVKVVHRTENEVEVEHKGQQWSIHVLDIKPAPAKRFTKKVTNPVK